MEDHLCFYARLKGFTGDEVKQAVQAAAAAVKLDAHLLKRLVKNLSGGMRRRLSVAIAVLGRRAAFDVACKLELVMVLVGCGQGCIGCCAA